MERKAINRSARKFETAFDLTFLILCYIYYLTREDRMCSKCSRHILCMDDNGKIVSKCWQTTRCHRFLPERKQLCPEYGSVAKELPRIKFSVDKIQNASSPKARLQ